MKYKRTIISLMAIALIAAPISPASAHGFHHHGWGGDGLFYGLLGAGAAVGVAAVTLATAPIRILADAAAPPPVAVSPPGYAVGSPPGYYASPPTAYAYPTAYPAAYPVYARPQRTVVYEYPQPVYGYAAPMYVTR